MDGGRVSGDLEVDAFVQVNLVSFPAWDLMVFLDGHPDRDFMLLELCTALARSEGDLESVLERFTTTGIAESHSGSDGRLRYRLTPDRDIREVLSRFCELASVREVRLEFVRHVMSRLAN
jgi:hypothetical protein